MGIGERRRHAPIGVLVVLAAAAVLTACTGPSPSPSPTRPASGSSSARPSATPSAAPVLDYSGTARQNLPFFDATNRTLIDADGTPKGRDFIDNLVRAGFAKSDMQVTADTTTVGLNADNIQFSVTFNGDCLIGQFGNIGYVSTVQPVLSTGACLVGSTRPIDW